jgi:transposase
LSEKERLWYDVTTNHLIVGIDIAKEVHLAGAVTFRGVHIGRPLTFSNDGFGFVKLLSWVRDLQQKHGLTQVIFGAESTGHYFLNLAFWLHQHGHKVVLVNPMTTKRNKENRDNKPSKNDTKDAMKES